MPSGGTSEAPWRQKATIDEEGDTRGERFNIQASLIDKMFDDGMARVPSDGSSIKESQDSPQKAQAPPQGVGGLSNGASGGAGQVFAKGHIDISGIVGLQSKIPVFVASSGEEGGIDLATHLPPKNSIPQQRPDQSVVSLVSATVGSAARGNGVREELPKGHSPRQVHPGKQRRDGRGGRGSRPRDDSVFSRVDREEWLKGRISARALEFGLGEEEEKAYEGFVRLLSLFDDAAMSRVCGDVELDVAEERLLNDFSGLG